MQKWQTSIFKRKITTRGIAILATLGILLAAVALWQIKNEKNDFVITKFQEPEQEKIDNRKAPPEEGAEPLSKEAPTPPATETKTEKMAQPTSAITPPGELTSLMQKYVGKEITQIPTQQKIIALTFDGGANADGAEKILETLHTNHLRATFFVTGKFAEKYPVLIKKIAAEGHEIGNHTYSHPYLTKISADAAKAEIKKTDDILRKLGVTPAPLFRCPYGDRNAAVNQTVSAAGYLNLRWTIDSLGWKGTSGNMSVKAVQKRVLANAKPGAILMMHLGSNPDDKTQLDSEALPQIITELQAEDYEFLPASTALLKN